MRKNEQKYKEALEELFRRTGLLLQQYTGRWDNLKEYDKRTINVLLVNQTIINEALGKSNR